MKICSTCKIEKSLFAFSANKNHCDGHQSQCKECRSRAEKERIHRLICRKHIVVPALLKCKCCKTVKSNIDFYGDLRQKSGKSAFCKDCMIKKQKLFYRQKRHKTYYNAHLKSRYGITINDYNCLLEKQNKKCAICDMTLNSNSKTKHLCVDHDHKTGKVRGLLCGNCNRLLGNAKDNVEILQKAIEYLNAH